MPRSMNLYTEIYPNLKSISDLFKLYMKSLDSFHSSITRWLSLVQPDTRLSPPLQRQSSLASMLMRYCCSMIGCYFFLDIIGSQKNIATYNFHIKNNRTPSANLKPLHQRMLFAKFGLNWSSGSGEVDENV